MRLFGKHIFRSIKARPLQPLIISLILSLCVTVMIVSVLLPINIYENEKADLGVDEWSADLSVTLKATSDLRLIFEDDVAAEVGECGVVIGEFSLMGFSNIGSDENGKIPIGIGAFDIEDASAFYGIEFVEKEKITNKNLNTTAIVSSWLAKERGITLGEALNINILGKEFTYTVRGIAADKGYFKGHGMMVDISSVKDTLAEKSAFAASLPKDFNPYTVAHIKVADGYGVNDLKTRLEGLEYFENKRIEVTGDSTKNDFFIRILTLTVLIPAMLLLIVAAMMIISTLELMTKKRQSELTLFRMVGADSGHLNRMLYLENSIYALVGGVVGSVFSIPIISALNRLYNFRYTRISLGAAGILIGLGSSLLFTSLCTCLHIRRRKAKSIRESSVGVNLDTDRHFTAKKLWYAVPIALITAVLILLPARYKYIAAIPLLFAIVFFLYVISPYVIGALSALALRLAMRKRRGTDIVLVANSAKNSYPLRHAGRIMAILVTMFISISTVLSATESHLDTYTGLATFDYAGVGVDKETRQRLEALDGIVAIADTDISRNVLFDGALTCTGIAIKGERELCFDKKIIPAAMPSGDAIVISTGVAKMIGAKVGDVVKCEIDGIPCELKLTEIIKSYGDFAFYDPDYVGVTLDMTCIRTDGSREANERLAALFDERGVACIERDDFFSSTYEKVNPQIVVLRAMFYAIVLMTVIGISNVLAEERMARKGEFEVLRQNGKTKRGIIKLCTVEALMLLVFALIIASVFSQAICLVVDAAATSFGMKLYI